MCPDIRQDPSHSAARAGSWRDVRHDEPRFRIPPRERRHVFAERFVRQLIDRFMKRMHQNRDVVVNGLLRDGIYVGIIAEYGRHSLMPHMPSSSMRRRQLGKRICIARV